MFVQNFEVIGPMMLLTETVPKVQRKKRSHSKAA